MKRRLALLGFLLLTFAASPTLSTPAPAFAGEDGGGYARPSEQTPPSYHHGMLSSDECGTYTWKADLTKGRTDSLLIHARHTEGCFTYDYTNYAPAGKGEAQGNGWQVDYCREEGQRDVARHFNYYRHLEIDPSSVRVTCTPYHGSD